MLHAVVVAEVMATAEAVVAVEIAVAQAEVVVSTNVGNTDLTIKWSRCSASTLSFLILAPVTSSLPIIHGRRGHCEKIPEQSSSLLFAFYNALIFSTDLLKSAVVNFRAI